MQCLGRHYVRYVNTSYKLSGTLWEWRYKSCVVDGDRDLLACDRYIKLNPVRASIVATPDAYRWSIYKTHAFGEIDPLLTPHAIYLSLAETDHERRLRYRALVAEAVDETDVGEIRDYLQ